MLEPLLYTSRVLYEIICLASYIDGGRRFNSQHSTSVCKVDVLAVEAALKSFIKTISTGHTIINIIIISDFLCSF